MTASRGICIRNTAYTLLNWKDTNNVYMNDELSEMPDAPRLGIEGENNGIGGISKRK